MRSCIVAVKVVTAVVIGLVVCGCQSGTSGESPAAEAFKIEMQHTLKELAAILIEPVSGADQQAVIAVIDSFCISIVEKTPPLNCGVAVMDKNGMTIVGRYPDEPLKTLNFSHYTVVKQALQERKIMQGRLFLQDGTRLYTIVAPLSAQGEVHGLFGLAFTALELTKRWGITEEEFMALDLNDEGCTP